MNINKLNLNNYNHWILSFLMLFIFIFVIKSPVSHTGSDPRSSLLLSQVLIENQSIKLDQYKDENYGSAIHKKNEHYYYYFPIGTSISSIPFVWLATKVLNKDMNNRQHDAVAQKHIAGIVSVLIFLLLFLISKMYFGPSASIFIGFVFWMGTSLSSTLGQALWSHDFATLYTLLSIFLMLKIVKENKELYWMPLGTVLFMAYLTRPTMSLLTIAVVLYIFFNHKKLISIKITSLVALFLGIFVLFSLSEFNQLLPDYYMPKRLSASETFWTAIYGNLLSPSRGLFIFSPIFLVLLLNIKSTYKVLKENKTLLIFVIWIIVHLIIISKFPHWWAGHSYGPRFMIDILPAIFLIFVIVLSNTYERGTKIGKIYVTLLLLITVPLSIYFNSIQGLYNVYAGSKWNGDPDIDRHPEYLFNWEYPQFLHNAKQHEERINEFNLRNLKPIISKVKIPFNSKIIQYSGWSHPESKHRWSLNRSSSIQFKHDNQKLNGFLNLQIGTLGEQEIKFSLNGHYQGSQIVNSWDSNLTFKFDTNLLNKDTINQIEFEFPNARKPNNGDQRILAMALKSFSIE